MENMENEIIFIKLDDIIPNRFQPREVFDENALNELADSIRQHGVIQPIVVRQVGNKYEIIAGERRYKASAIAGLTKIPAIIKNLDDKESSIVAYIENAQRRNVSAIEEARTSERILKTNNMTQEQLARELGISQSALANKLRLLSLPLEVQEALMKNEISERHARSLLSVKEPEKQIELLNKVKTNKMTVRELESEIRNMFGNNTPEDNNDGGMFINNNMNAEFIPTNMNNNSFVNNNLNNQFVDNTNNFSNQFINNDFNNMNNNFNSSNPTFNQPISTFENNMPSNNNIVENNNFNSNMTTQQPIDDNTPSFENNSFLNFENNFDPSKYEKGYVENNEPQIVENVTTPIDNGNNGSFLDFLNGYDTNYPNASNDVMNSMDNNMPNNEVNGAQNDDFMNFLNNSNEPLTTNEDVNNTSVDDNNSTAGEDFMNFVNNYDSMPNNNLAGNYDNIQPVVNNVASEPIVNYQPTPLANNPIINDVIPPVTSNFNEFKYVEDDDRYKDITKSEMLTSVDDIISELKVIVDKIKNNSKFKIDTDEINFDDMYQITIKIDKRDIL